MQVKKWLTTLSVTALICTGYGCSAAGNAMTPPAQEETPGTSGAEGASTGQAPAEQAADDAADMVAVTNLVDRFGEKLQFVSLLAPEETVRESLEEHYGGLVAPELLGAWGSDPSSAPGRTVSSPWPDRIEMSDVAKAADGEYRVTGSIVEVTSEEQEAGEAAAIRPIELTVKRVADGWRIDAVALGEYEDAGTGTGANAVGPYVNEEYGFTFALPDGWSGYTIVAGEWEGKPVEGDGAAESGPLVTIRHPAWTEEVPRQDIPIMVVTPEQWQAIRDGELSVGAAPVPPSELGRNGDYVFALPARYNFAFPAGYEEVEDILADGPLQPIEPTEPQEPAQP